MNEIDRLLIETLREVVSGNEDYVYVAPSPPPIALDGWAGTDACFYRDRDGNPSCGIGHVADRLGLPIRENERVSNLAFEWGASKEVAHYLGRFQRGQDERKTWGVALQRAEAFLARHDVEVS